MAQLLDAFTFQVGYSPQTRAAIQAENGDYILAGRLFGETGKSSGFALRVQPNSFPAWEKTCDAEFDAFFTALAQIADGTFIAVGSLFRSEFAGDEDIWVVNLDADGNVLWQDTYGRADLQSDGYDVAATADGGFVVAGVATPRPGGAISTRVIKFDQDRAVEWDKNHAGGAAFAVTELRKGGYVLSGASNIPDSLNSYVYALRLDEFGERTWERVYRDFEVFVLLRSDVAETGDGFAIAARNVIMTVDRCGDPIWARQVLQFNLGSIVALPDGLLAVGGNLLANDFEHAYVAVINRTGTTIFWDNTELLYNSDLARVLVNRDGFVTGGGWAPFGDQRNQAVLAVFNRVREIV